MASPGIRGNEKLNHAAWRPSNRSLHPSGSLSSFYPLPHCVSIHALATSSFAELLPSSGLTSNYFSLNTFSSVRTWVCVFFSEYFSQNVCGLCFSSLVFLVGLPSSLSFLLPSGFHCPDGNVVPGQPWTAFPTGQDGHCELGFQVYSSCTSSCSIKLSVTFSWLPKYHLARLRLLPHLN